MKSLRHLFFCLTHILKKCPVLKYRFLCALGENEESGRDCERPSDVFRCSPGIHGLAPFSEGRTSPLVRYVGRFISHPEEIV